MGGVDKSEQLSYYGFVTQIAKMVKSGSISARFSQQQIGRPNFLYALEGKNHSENVSYVAKKETTGRPQYIIARNATHLYV